MWDYWKENLGAIHSTKIPTGPTGKRGPPQKVDPFFRNLFRLDRTDPLSFGPKFPEIFAYNVLLFCSSNQAQRSNNVHDVF